MEQASQTKGPDGPLTDQLIKFGKFFSRWDETDDGRAVFREGGRKGDTFYRDRWSHDKEVRSTHGVNCTGSCSWKVYVKDGIITWEAQQTDYPTVGPDRPEYEPRGCPRGAAFSWYTYSPTRVKYPYVRGLLLEMYREAKALHSDPVEAFHSIVSDPVKRNRYISARGKGGLVRSTWAEALEIVAAAHVHTIKYYGPDRCTGFTPIPAMSMVSFSAGVRFIQLIGGVMTSFYDWYADLPVASPQVFGDQTDVPESGDWWDASYLIMWGSNIPVTRTPDAHWVAEVRYRGTKVVSVSPDYADNTKFADEWLPAQAGTDAALAMAMGHVILKENYVDQRVEFFEDFALTYTDLPFLVTLETREDGTKVPSKFLTAASLAGEQHQENADFKTAMMDRETGEVFVPNGTMGHRYSESDQGKWNLELDGRKPILSIRDLPQGESAAVEIKMPTFDNPKGHGDIMTRGVPVTYVEGQEVTTVFDLMLATYGIGRPGLPGDWAKDYEDWSIQNTPAWQEQITSVPPEAVIRVAREFAQNAIDSHGRSMIIFGAGICQWYHADTTYRAILALLNLTGCQGRNGGGWAHYVGQEKARPLTGLTNMANALDWSRPPRHMIGTGFWYMHTDQFRQDGYSTDYLQSPLGTGELKGVHTADVVARSTRMGWMPFYPQFPENSLDLADKAEAAVARGEAKDNADYVAQRLNSGDLEFSVEDVDNPVNWPRTLMLWRSNLFGSSAKGESYFLKHLVGSMDNVQGADHEESIPREVTWYQEAPKGKLDLLVTSDFRMTTTTLLSDVVLPTATWYEKHDISSTDMHPFLHAFSPAIDPPWEARTDHDTFKALSYEFTRQAKKHLGTRKDIVSVPLLHDTPGQIKQPGGYAPDWKSTPGMSGVPGKNMPNFMTVERDYSAMYDMYTSVGPLFDKVGATTKYVTYDLKDEVAQMAKEFGVMDSGKGAGRPALDTDTKLAESILRISGTSNGEVALKGFKELEKQTGLHLMDLAEGNEERKITFPMTQAAPQPVMTSPEWSGSETGGRRYAPFTVNIEKKKPFHTLTGRMHFFLDHDWMHEMGEALPIYRPPLDMTGLFKEPEIGTTDGVSVAVRYLTPHYKWAIHSQYFDNQHMLTLFRGGQTAWMSPQDAEKIGVKDGEWIECVNTNGVFVGRAVVSHRMPEGVCYVHHAQERMMTPKTETTGKRGGIHNSMTRILLKPTHMIGGYAHLAFAFNYLGPTGNQRDIVSYIRRRKSQEVTF